MICVNCRFVTQKLTGVQRFAYELSIRLKLYYGDEIIFLSPKNIIQLEMAKKLDVLVIGSFTGYLWEQIELPLWLYKKGSPVLINFCSVAPLYYNNSYIAVHDITFERYPQTYSWKFRMLYKYLIPRLCHIANKIITVSDFSKIEISSFYNIPVDRFLVIYNATSDAFRPVIDNVIGEKQYFLAVSSVKANKNFLEVLQAFDYFQEKEENVYLYIIGDIHDKNFNRINIEKYKSNKNIVFLGRVSDEDLIKYYSNSIGFIFPSIYEGFGIPVIEAQACGCPVISSNSSSLPEVLRESALFYTPGDTKKLSEVMNELYIDKSLRQNIIDRGFLNVRRFSWDKSASIITDLIPLQ